MIPADEQTSQLVAKMSEAKTWPAQLKAKLDKGLDVEDEIEERGRKVEALEKRAREVIRELGRELGCPVDG